VGISATVKPGWERHRIRFIAALTAVVITSAAGPSPIRATPDDVAPAILTPGRLVIDYADAGPFVSGPVVSDRAEQIAVEEFRSGLRPETRPTPGKQTQVGGFTACYDGDVPAAVRQTIDQSLQAWSTALLLGRSSIEVDVFWIPFSSPNTLAASGPTLFVQDASLPNPGARYPVALANRLTDRDFAPRSRCDLSAAGEIVLYLNSTVGGDGAAWHIDSTQPLGPDQHDLSTVALHELAHGLGFVSSAAVTNSGATQWPGDGGAPYIYDTFFSRCNAGSSCHSDIATSVAVASGASVNGDDLWFETPHSPLLRLYAPTTWNNGSSLSHLDEAYYGPTTPFALMSPFVGNGESQRTIDNAVLTVMQTMGWPISDPPAQPGKPQVQAANASAQLVFDLPDLTVGVPPESYELDIFRNGVLEQRAQIPGRSINLTGLQNGSEYVFVAIAHTAGGSQISPPSDPVTPLELPPFSTAEALSEQLFETFNGRPPTAAELATWSAHIRASDDLNGIIVDFSRLAGGEQQRRITRLYLGFFGRHPDDEGLAFWIERGRAGESLERIALQFARATEFEQGSTVSDEKFVTATYQRVLNRSPDEAGLAYWVGRLQRDLDRGRLLLLFSESLEHRTEAGPTSEVLITFWTLLGRQPSSADFARWTPVAAAEGARPLIDAIIGSTEFKPR
jgi:hypothetical protein